jgi:hypothetical protein
METSFATMMLVEVSFGFARLAAHTARVTGVAVEEKKKNSFAPSWENASCCCWAAVVEFAKEIAVLDTTAAAADFGPETVVPS